MKDQRLPANQDNGTAFGVTILPSKPSQAPTKLSPSPQVRRRPGVRSARIPADGTLV